MKKKMANKMRENDIPVYNILLLGESGVGKSTFVNSFVNYVQFETLEEARKNGLRIIIPVQFEVTDNDEQLIQVSEGGTSDNECLESGHSGTKWCKSYLIQSDTLAIRLLDAPGLGSTVSDNEHKMDTHKESVEQDRVIIKDILQFITSFQHLHAIAIVVKANETRYSDRFDYCLKRLMNNLNKSAFNNIVFIVNFASDNSYAVPPSLRKKLQELTSKKDINKERMFAFDQKCFRYLLAAKNGAKYDDDEKSVFAKAWLKSQDSCTRLLNLITQNEEDPGFEPYEVADTLSIHDARLFIQSVEPVLKDIFSVIEKNENKMKSYLDEFNNAKVQTNYLENKIKHLQYIEIRVISVDEPLTICYSEKCTRTHKSEDGTVMEHHKSVCCDGCLVTGSAWRRRLFCQKFRLANGLCKNCECHVNEHQRVYYRTEEVNHQDENVSKLLTATDEETAIKKLIAFIKNQQKKLKNEKLLIESATTKFLDFLCTNPIFLDPDELVRGGTDAVILPHEVYAIKNQLFGLEIYGKRIREAYEIAKNGAQKERNLNEETNISLKLCVKKIRFVADNFKNKALISSKQK